MSTQSFIIGCLTGSLMFNALLQNDIPAIFFTAIIGTLLDVSIAALRSKL